MRCSMLLSRMLVVRGFTPFSMTYAEQIAVTTGEDSGDESGEEHESASNRDEDEDEDTLESPASLESSELASY
jgi:hypothetical protein